MGSESSLPMTPFALQGCDACRAHWISHSDQPKLLGVIENEGAEFYRCDVCGSYWQAGFTYAHVIARSSVLSALPWVDERHG